MTEQRGRASRRRLVAAVIGFGALTASVAAGTNLAHAAPVKPAIAGFTIPTFIKTIGAPGDAYVYPWGMATETIGADAGDIVVSDYNNNDIKIFDPRTSTTPGALVQQLGGKNIPLETSPISVSAMGQPYGVAVDPNDGSIYVADLVHQRVDKFVYNSSGQFVFSYDIAPRGAGYAPYVAVNSAGDLFIVESTIVNSGGRNEIFEYNNAGQSITTYVGFNGTNCATGQFGNIRGIDVDAANNLYVMDTTDRCILVFNTENGSQFTPWQLEGYIGNSTNLSADTRGLTIDRTNGIVYVADNYKQVVDVFDTWNGTPGGTFVGTIGTAGSDIGQLGAPRGVAIGLDGTLYVSDYADWRVNEYYPLSSSTPGAYIDMIPDPPIPAPPGGFNDPTDVAVSTAKANLGDIYVADTFNQRIQEFSPTGTFITMWGSRLPNLAAGTSLDYPRGVAVDPNSGNVWVNDTRSGYIKAYSQKGVFIPTREYGGEGSGVGQFFYSVGIYVANGEVYIPDSGNDRLQVLSLTTGAEEPGFPVECGFGFGAGINGGCDGVTVDAAGNIYASASEQDEVYVFSSTGSLITTIGSSATLSEPYDVAISGANLYITDAASSQVSEYNISVPTAATYLGTWGVEGTAPGQLNQPRGISVDAAGNIYIVDYGNNRIEEFTASS